MSAKSERAKRKQRLNQAEWRKKNQEHNQEQLRIYRFNQRGTWRMPPPPIPEPPVIADSEPGELFQYELNSMCSKIRRLNAE